MDLLIFAYSLLSLMLGFAASLILYLYYKRERVPVLKKFIYTLAAFSLVVLLLNVDFFTRSIFHMGNSIYYFTFFFLFLLYACGLVIYAYSLLVMELTGTPVTKAFKIILFIAAFFPLYLYITIIYFSRTSENLQVVFYIAAGEIIIVLSASFILLGRRFSGPAPAYKGYRQILVRIILCYLPFCFIDFFKSQLWFVLPALSGVIYFTTLFYLFLNGVLISRGLRELANRPAFEAPAPEPGSVIPAGNLKLFGISEREREIAVEIMKGKSNQAIADEKFIALITVKRHVYNLFQKTGAKNRIELINLLLKKIDT